MGRQKNLIVKNKDKFYSVSPKDFLLWLRNKRAGFFPGKALIQEIHYDISELKEEDVPGLLDKIWHEDHK